MGLERGVVLISSRFKALEGIELPGPGQVSPDYHNWQYLVCREPSEIKACIY